MGRPAQFRTLLRYLRDAGFDASVIAFPTLVAPFDRGVEIARGGVGRRGPLHLSATAWAGW